MIAAAEHRGQGQARLCRGGAADRRDDASALYIESSRSGDFDAYVEEVRTAHKPKRNLMKLMAGLEPAGSKP
jgi:hypothetical protein